MISGSIKSIELDNSLWTYIPPVNFGRTAVVELPDEVWMLVNNEMFFQGTFEEIYSECIKIVHKVPGSLYLKAIKYMGL